MKMELMEKVTLTGAATEILRTEHEAVLQVLNVLEKAVERLETGLLVGTTLLSELTEFLVIFVDKCHHTKEEKILFPLLEQNGIVRENGPIGCMLNEHVEGRGYIQRMQIGLVKLQIADRAGVAYFAKNARGYIELLRAHIVKENSVLFRLADFVLPGEVQQELAAQFEVVEHDQLGAGTHERLHAKIEKWLELTAIWKAAAAI